MYTFLVIIICLLCSGLVGLVIIQNSKGGGLATNMRGAAFAANMMGSVRAANLVEKLTWWFIGLIALLTFVANIYLSTDIASQRKAGDLRMEKLQSNVPAASQPATPNPVAPKPAK